MARAEGASEPLNERAGILHVCRFGPDVALARARRLQGPAEITAAGVLSNPSLVIEHQRTLTGAAERETIVGVSVPLHLSGRRGLLQEAAEARVQEANADADTTLFDSVLGFREAFVAAALDLAEAQVLADQQSALDSLSTTIQALSQSGEAAGYDLLRQRAEARLHRIQLETRRATALASRALAERWTDAELMLSPIDPFSLAGSPIGANVLEVPDRSSPHVRSLRAAHRASTLEATAARCRWVPEFQLFGGYRALDVEGETAHGLSLELTCR